MGAHVFVDETKTRGFYIAAAVVLPEVLASARRVMASLVLPGQRRLHFCKEKDARRNQIVKAITALKIEAVIFDASATKDQKVARDQCLSALVDDLVKRQAVRLVLERDDSTVRSDRQLLVQRCRQAGIHDLRYDHLRAHEECLLTIPDALAWCWVRGGEWRQKVNCLVVDTQIISGP